jgi:hypothetical protein
VTTFHKKHFASFFGTSWKKSQLERGNDGEKHSRILFKRQFFRVFFVFGRSSTKSALISPPHPHRKGKYFVVLSHLNDLAGTTKYTIIATTYSIHCVHMHVPVCNRHSHIITHAMLHCCVI